MQRNNTVASTIRYVRNGEETVYASQNGVGIIQYISALNNAPHVRVPGEFHANPVVMWKSHVTPKLGRTSETISTYKNRSAIEGDLAGYCLLPLKCTPSQLVQYYATWNNATALHAQNRAFAAAAAPDLDLGVQLGEMKEALSSLPNLLQALRKYIKDYNKLTKTWVPGVTMRNTAKNSKRASDLNLFSGSWLEWRYGIRPILQTIQDVIDHVNAQSYAYSGKMLRRAGKVKSSKTVNLSNTTGPGSYTLNSMGTFDVKQRYVSKLYFTEDSPLSLEYRYGIDLTNVLPVWWEIVPLSFIVDRFYNIGDWIGALKFYQHPRTVKGMVTSCKTTIEGRAWIQEIKFENTSATLLDTPWVDVKIEHLNRKVISTPRVTWTPTLDAAHHSLSMLLDEITLIWQRMPKPKRY